MTYETASLIYGDPRSRFQQRVFAVKDSSPCIGVVFFLRTGNLSAPGPDAPKSQLNAGPGKQTAFQALTEMRRSFTLLRK